MIDHLASLAALGPGLGAHTNGPPDIREFAQRRVDHLKEKVESGEIDAEKLKHRLAARFGEAADGVISEDGDIDFEKLQDLITAQQTVKLQDRLESWLGREAKGIVGSDGRIDRAKFETLHAAQDTERLQARLSEHFGERADGVISEDGAVNVESLRALFASREQGQPHEPLDRHERFGKPAIKDNPFLDFLT